MSPTQRLADVQRTLAAAGQGHLLAFWNALSDSQRLELLSELDQVDFALCQRLIPEYVHDRPALAMPQRIEAAAVLPAVPTGALAAEYEDARGRGRAAIAAGQVAAFTVAGGQGTRLGFDGPKGVFRISPVRGASLFQLFAEFLRGCGRRYGCVPPWYIMTSSLNHDATCDYFRESGYFGLHERDVMFFRQREMPAFLPDGRIALRAPHRLALSPDGHGGSLRALAESGALADMARRGVRQISYFQVDNPLVKPIDPLFVGLHIARGSEMSSKAVTKAADTERVGNFCLADGKLTVIEYSDLPPELATAKNADGSRRFDAGSIAIHVLEREFVERLTRPGSGVQLPWHRADKKQAVVNPQSGAIDQQDVVKLEMFVFDAIPLARNPLVLYTRREEEFSPVKNAEGVDSPATTRRDLVRRAAAWLEGAGVRVPRGADGEPACTVEIRADFALDAEDLRTQLVTPPRLEPDARVVVE